MLVTRSFLIEGALASLEQAATLLADANALQKMGRKGSALALASLSVELVGQFQILLDYKESLLSGKTVTTKNISKLSAPGSHRIRQRAAGAGLTLTDAEAHELIAIGSRLFDTVPGTQEHLEAKKELDAAHANKLADQAKKRLQLRMSVTYVDVNPGGQGWTRPQDVEEIDVQHVFRAANIAYAVAWARLSTEDQADEDFKNWPARARLPHPDKLCL